MQHVQHVPSKSLVSCMLKIDSLWAAGAGPHGTSESSQRRSICLDVLNVRLYALSRSGSHTKDSIHSETTAAIPAILCRGLEGKTTKPARV